MITSSSILHFVSCSVASSLPSPSDCFVWVSVSCCLSPRVSAVSFGSLRLVSFLSHHFLCCSLPLFPFPAAEAEGEGKILISFPILSYFSSFVLSSSSSSSSSLSFAFSSSREANARMAVSSSREEERGNAIPRSATEEAKGKERRKGRKNDEGSGSQGMKKKKRKRGTADLGK